MPEGVRDAEVEHLRRVLGQAGARPGQVVATIGEAGVGKLRLTYEFTQHVQVVGFAGVDRDAEAGRPARADQRTSTSTASWSEAARVLK